MAVVEETTSLRKELSVLLDKSPLEFYNEIIARSGTYVVRTSAGVELASLQQWGVAGL